jgi:hypothetical protein
MARHALLIATTQHPDAVFSRLTAPDADVKSFGGALRSPNVGGFDSVVELVNRPSDVVREEIEGFFQGRTDDDLLVLYFAGHAVANSRGLHLVTTTTKRDRLAATAVAADFVRELMDTCPSRQKVVILDCCYSGTSDRAEGGVGASAGTAAAFEGNGLGRVVMTATDAIECAFEVNDPTVNPRSAFTHCLAEGLESGAADLDRDGQITINELYEYVRRQLVKTSSKKSPDKWNYWQPSDFGFAKNPRPVPRPDLISPKLLAALESTERWEVEGALRELVRLQDDPNPGLALAAKEKLDTLVKRVSERPRAAPAAEVASTAAASSGPRAATPTLDSGSGPARNPVSPAASETKPVEVPVPAIPPPPAELASGVSPTGSVKQGVKSYTNLRPRSVRPSSQEQGAAEVALPAPVIPAPDLAPVPKSAAVSPPVPAPADASPEPSQVSVPLPEPIVPAPAPPESTGRARRARGRRCRLARPPAEGNQPSDARQPDGRRSVFGAVSTRRRAAVVAARAGPVVLEPGHFGGAASAVVDARTNRVARGWGGRASGRRARDLRIHPQGFLEHRGQADRQLVDR